MCVYGLQGTNWHRNPMQKIFFYNSRTIAHRKKILVSNEAEDPAFYLSLIHLLALTATENELFQKNQNNRLFSLLSVIMKINDYFDFFEITRFLLQLKLTNVLKTDRKPGLPLRLTPISSFYVLWFSSYKNGGMRNPKNLELPQGIKTSIFQKKFFALGFCANLSPVNHIGTYVFKKVHTLL